MFSSIFNLCLVHPKTKNFSRFSITSNLTTYAWSIKYRYKQKLIAQFACKSGDESFKPSYFMIEQYLSNKSKSATLSKSKNILDLNKAKVWNCSHRSYLVHGEKSQGKGARGWRMPALHADQDNGSRVPTEINSLVVFGWTKQGLSLLVEDFSFCHITC